MAGKTVRRRHYDPLTYRYPRTMEEAFPPTPIDYACAVTKYTNFKLKIVNWIIRFGWLVIFLATIALTSKGYQS